MRSGRKRPGGVSRSAMSHRWTLGEEARVHRGNAPAKNAGQGGVTSLGSGYAVRSARRLACRIAFRFIDNRITASEAHGRKTEETRNHHPGATECSRTWLLWKALNTHPAPANRRSRATTGTARPNASTPRWRAELLSEPQGEQVFLE